VIFSASLASLITLIINLIWWVKVKKNITVQAPLRETSEKIQITIFNNNKNLELTDLSVYPLKLKLLTFPSSLNTLYKDELGAYFFMAENSKIKPDGSAILKIAEVYKHEKIDFPVINFLIGKQGYIFRYYFPFITSDKTSSDLD